MNLKKSKVLIVSFAIILLGIIGVQLYWMKTALDVRRKQFDDAVFSSLQNLSNQMEQKENILLINQVSEIDSMDNLKQNQKTVKIITKTKNTKEIRSSYSFSVKNDSVSVEIESNDKNNVEFVNSDTIINDKQIIDNKLSKVKVLINKIIGAENKDLFKIDVNAIKKDLAANLYKNNIETNFEFAINENNKTTFVSDSIRINDILASNYQTKIFPVDILNRNISIAVFFPSKTSYLLSNTIWVILILFVFVVVLFSIFYITLNNYNKQKKLNEIKSDFINNMSHELKTPLATIQLASAIINQSAKPDQEQIKNMAQTIKDQSRKIDKDIKNILQQAVLENRNDIQPQLVLTDAVTFIKNCIQQVELIAQEKKISIVLNASKYFNFRVDVNLMQQAIINLLDNAIKYSSGNSEVTVDLNQSQTTTIKVSDKGCGMEKEDLQHIFEKFYRVGKGNIHDNKGFGLGLNIVKQIVELHKGTIKAESKLKEGTCITIELPNNE